MHETCSNKRNSLCPQTRKRDEKTFAREGNLLSDTVFHVLKHPNRINISNFTLTSKTRMKDFKLLEKGKISSFSSTRTL